jgi:hypothetical protein
MCELTTTYFHNGWAACGWRVADAVGAVSAILLNGICGMEKKMCVIQMGKESVVEKLEEKLLECSL